MPSATQPQPETYASMADAVEDTLPYDALFDPLATMDTIKWQTVLDQLYPWWLPGARHAVASELAARHFGGVL